MALAATLASAPAGGGGGAHAGIAATRCGEKGWPATAEGAPSSLRAASAAGYYVWHDLRGFHLELRSAPGTALSGRIVADAALRLLAASPGFRSAVRNNVLSFGPKRGAKAARIDFGASCAGSLAFSLGDAQAASPVLLGAKGPAPARSFELRRPAATGVSGTILVGPACPVLGAGCSGEPKHVRGTVRVETAPTSRSGDSPELVTTVETDAEGKFSVDLPSGHYSLIVVKKEPGFPLARPTLVDVEAGVVSDVTLVLDTGIR